MRRCRLACAAALLACTAAFAAPDDAPQAAASTPKTPAPQRFGYAFEYPRVLAQQRLFGIAHGVGLLAAACRAAGHDAPASSDAYAAWLVRQRPAIDAARRDLAGYYRLKGDDDGALTKSMHLKDALGLAAGSTELIAACATLPQALAQPRYDLATRIGQEEQMARVIAAVEVEAHNAYCQRFFSDRLREVHDARLAVWREINAPLAAQAQASLASGWPPDGPAATFDDWLAALRRDTRPGGSASDCLEFSASLRQPATALRNIFVMPPQ